MCKYIKSEERKSKEKKKRTITEQVAFLLLTSHRYVIFLIDQVDKKESGQTISHFIGILPRMLTTTRVNGHSLVTGYRYEI